MNKYGVRTQRFKMADKPEEAFAAARDLSM